MELISSDTNIWIDFDFIGCLDEPFKLKNEYKYLMSADALRDEILSPPELGEKLVGLGLEAVEITETEYMLVTEYGEKYSQLSVYDRIALSIAASRQIKLLSGDKALRIAAKKENVEVHGTLWLLDMLLLAGKIDKSRYIDILSSMKNFNGSRIRLPEKEIEKRLKCSLS